MKDTPLLSSATGLNAGAMKDWNESGIIRRDARQTIVREIRPPGRSGKDIRKWCRGKIGVEHKPVCMAYGDLKNTTGTTPISREWRVLVCTECDKHLDHWYPWPWGRRREKPRWVVE